MKTLKHCCVMWKNRFGRTVFRSWQTEALSYPSETVFSTNSNDIDKSVVLGTLSKRFLNFTTTTVLIRHQLKIRCNWFILRTVYWMLSKRFCIDFITETVLPGPILNISCKLLQHFCTVVNNKYFFKKRFCIKSLLLYLLCLCQK